MDGFSLDNDKLPAGFTPRNNDGPALKSLLRDLNNAELTGANVPRGINPMAEVDAAQAAKKAAAQAQAEAMQAAEGMGQLIAATPQPPAGVIGALGDGIGEPQAFAGQQIVAGPAEGIDFTAAAPSTAAKLCFTGRTHVGKDYVATAVGAKIFGFADPLYELLEFFFGARNRDLPGARQFLQKVGQWGRGEINANYPLTPERAITSAAIRVAAKEGMLPSFVDWDSYGKNQDIWLDACLKRVSEFSAENPTERVAISNVRFDNELKRLTAEGFIHTHVVCSPTTWQQRLAKDKIAPDAPLLKDISEQLAARLDASVVKNLSTKPTGGKLFCVWNDTVKIPSARLLTVAELNQQIATKESAL